MAWQSLVVCLFFVRLAERLKQQIGSEIAAGSGASGAPSILRPGQPLAGPLSPFACVVFVLLPGAERKCWVYRSGSGQLHWSVGLGPSCFRSGCLRLPDCKCQTGRQADWYRNRITAWPEAGQLLWPLNEWHVVAGPSRSGMPFRLITF